MLSGSVATEGYGPFTFLYGLALALSLTLILLFAYIAWCAFTIKYRLNKDNLVLGFGGVKQIIPLSSIETIYAPGQKADGAPVNVRWRGMADIIPGYLTGSGVSPQLGKVAAVATTPANGQLFIVTKTLTFALSPQRPLAFIDEITSRMPAARAAAAESSDPAPQPHTQVSRWLTLGADLWADRVARRLLLGGLLACTLFFAYMSMIYNGLPGILPLHWNSQAQIDRVGDPQELLRLPVIALGVWLVNTVLAALASRRERAATLFLLAGAIAVPVVFAAGALSIVLRTT